MTDLRLNFTPLELSGASIDFQTLPYRDRDHLSELRQQYLGRFAFLRRGELIYALPMEASTPRIGTEGRASVDDLYLVRSLVEQRLVSLFAARKRLATGYQPLSFIGRQLQFGAGNFEEWIEARSRLLVSPRLLELPGERSMLGLVWDVEVERSLPASLSRLMELGLEPEGLIFETEFVPADPRFAPRRRLAGRVERIDGNVAVLGERHKLAAERIPLAQLYLEPKQLIWTLSNFALATYAKLGGVPWLIKSDTSIAHEIVIGLGSASIGESRFSRRERLVGITSVFRGDGGYLLSNLSQAVPFDKYQSTLTESLKTTLHRVRSEMNWQPGDAVRIVVHAFKPLRDTEVQAVKDCLATIDGFEVTFAFLHVKQEHPWLLFDQASKGIFGKGERAPDRGLFAELGTHEALCTLVGPKELKRPTDGLPRPVLLTLHRDSTFTDMVYLTKQVFWFSSHSWRSFLPASMPVTILYSELVAGLLGRLAQLGTRWSSSVMLGRIGTTRWFL